MRLQPVAEFAVALPVKGFLQAFAALERLRDQLAKQGLISSGSTESGAQPPKPGKSPNFP